MRMNQLGRTGLFVSELCLGTMTFGGGSGHMGVIAGLGQAEADAIVRQAFDAGINFLDTANIYAMGQSETITGLALKNLGIAREDVVIATKVFGSVGPGANARGASRGHIMNAVKGSLERLGTDYIDLYQLHGWDPVTPIEESLRALDDLVRQGHVRYIGISNWAAWQITKALGISELRNLEKFATVQAYYSIAGRDLERELIPMMQSEGLGLMVWSPLAGGFLSGKYSRDGDGEGRRTGFDFPPLDKERGFDIIDVMRPMAQARNGSVAQIALAWLLHQRAVTSVIVGAKRSNQLAENLAACAVELSDVELASLEEASRLVPEYPSWMFTMQGKGRIPG